MVQFKTPVEGRDAGGPQGTYWMSPQRDIAINFPVLVEKALSFCVELKTNEHVKNYFNKYPEEEGMRYLTELTKCLIEFVRQTTEVPNIKVSEAYKASNLEGTNKDAFDLFCYAFMAVTFSAYFHSAREASRGTFNPFILSDLRTIVNDV